MVLLKWVGSKNTSKRFIADVIGTVEGDYYEPFLGGGSVAWELIDRGAIRGKIILSDIDRDLMSFWEAVQKWSEEIKQNIIERVDSGLYCAENYYRIRSIFNSEVRNDDVIKMSDTKSRMIHTASVVYYLNRTGFNGLWRRNRSGKYNVPVGDNHGVQIDIMSSEIDLHTKRLQECTFITAEFDDQIRMAGKNDVVYCDPPYYSATGKNFTQYDGKIFDKNRMDTLFAVMTDATRRGARCFLSSPGYFVPTEKQKKRIIDTNDLMVGRAVNSNGSGRGKVKEYLLTISHRKIDMIGAD